MMVTPAAATRSPSLPSRIDWPDQNGVGLRVVPERLVDEKARYRRVKDDGEGPGGRGPGRKQRPRLLDRADAELLGARGVNHLEASHDPAVLDAKLRHAVLDERELTAYDDARRFLVDERAARVRDGLAGDDVAVGDDGVDDARAAVLAARRLVCLDGGELVGRADRTGVAAEGGGEVPLDGLGLRDHAGVGDAQRAGASQFYRFVERGQERLAAEGVRRDETPRAVHEHANARARLALLAHFVRAAVLHHCPRRDVLDHAHVGVVHPAPLGDEHYLFGNALPVRHRATLCRSRAFCRRSAAVTPRARFGRATLRRKTVRMVLRPPLPVNQKAVSRRRRARKATAVERSRSAYPTSIRSRRPL